MDNLTIAAPVLERLCASGSPRDFPLLNESNTYLLETCRLSKADVPELIEIALKWPELDWPGEKVSLPDDVFDPELLPVAAWRALAELRAAECVEPLLEMLRDYDDEEDDWAYEDLPVVFGRIGEPALDDLEQFAADQSAGGQGRGIAVRGLECIARNEPQCRNRIAAALTTLMQHAAEQDVRLNTNVLCVLVDLEVVEAAEPIERAFAGNHVDVGMFGPWEEVRIKLNVPGLGLEMPEQPYNSLDHLRFALGQSAEDASVFDEYGDLDKDAADSYFETTIEGFSQSASGRKVIEQSGRIFWTECLMRFGLDFRGETLAEMTVASIAEFLEDYVPRKVSAPSIDAPEIIQEMIALWQYVAQQQLPESDEGEAQDLQTRKILAYLQEEGRTEKLAAAMDDPRNFGMAKSFFMGGLEAGYDMRSEEGVAQYTARFNEAVHFQSDPEPPEPEEFRPPPILLERGRQVGRNEACPCGSGKKYKKCCLKASN